MKRLLLILLSWPLFLFAQTDYSQMYWIFGGGVPNSMVFDYSNSAPKLAATFGSKYLNLNCNSTLPIWPTPNVSLINSNNYTGNLTSSNYTSLGSAVLTDAYTGQMIIYSDGKNIYDQNHNKINSAPLGGNQLGSQPVVICKKPSTCLDSIYYLFVNQSGRKVSDYNNNYTAGKILYYEFNINSNSIESGPYFLDHP